MSDVDQACVSEHLLLSTAVQRLSKWICTIIAGRPRVEQRRLRFVFGFLLPHFYHVSHFGVARRSLLRSVKVKAFLTISVIALLKRFAEAWYSARCIPLLICIWCSPLPLAASLEQCWCRMEILRTGAGERILNRSVAVHIIGGAGICGILPRVPHTVVLWRKVYVITLEMCHFFTLENRCEAKYNDLFSPKYQSPPSAYRATEEGNAGSNRIPKCVHLRHRRHVMPEYRTEDLRF
jgi:hypothetical protein